MNFAFVNDRYSTTILVDNDFCIVMKGWKWYMNQFVVIDNVCYLLKCNDQCSSVFWPYDYSYNLYDLDILKQNHNVITKSYSTV